MSKIKINLVADIVLKDGQKRLAFKNPDYYRDQINRLDERKKVLVTIENVKTNRSQQQNKYWWAACFPVIAEITGYTIEEAHELCVNMFIPPKFLQVKEKEYAVRKGSSELSKSEGVEFTDKVRNLAVELGGYIPTPEEAGYAVEKPMEEHKNLPVYPSDEYKGAPLI